MIGTRAPYWALEVVRDLPLLRQQNLMRENEI